MSENLKPGQVRIFQCESCGDVFDEKDLCARSGSHIGVEAVDDGHGNPEPSPFQCGPITERILMDETVCRNETIEECAKTCEQMVKEIVCPEECAAAIRDMKEVDE